MPGYPPESLAPGLSSKALCCLLRPLNFRAPEETADWRLCPYLITLSWALMFSCDIFMRRSGNWMSTKKVRSLGSQPMSKRCSRAVWMQDRAGSKDLKRPWRWKLPKLPITHGDDRNSGSQRRGMSVSGKRKGTPDCWFGFLTLSFQISQTPYKPSSKNILSKWVLKASSSKVSTLPGIPHETFYRKGLSNTAQLWSTARSGPATTSPGHAAQAQRRTIWFKVYVYTTYYGGDWGMVFKFLKLR